MCYISATEPGVARGPHDHVDQADYFCSSAVRNFKLYLWDTGPSRRPTEPSRRGGRGRHADGGGGAGRRGCTPTRTWDRSGGLVQPRQPACTRGRAARSRWTRSATRSTRTARTSWTEPTRFAATGGSAPALPPVAAKRNGPPGLAPGGPESHHACAQVSRRRGASKLDLERLANHFLPLLLLSAVSVSTALVVVSLRSAWIFRLGTLAVALGVLEDRHRVLLHVFA